MNGLEALEKLPQWLDDEHRDREEKYFKASEEYKTIEKELKAFEIIKNKGIDIITLKAHKKAKTYNKHTKFAYCKDYTDEEFDLLKEVMK